MDKVYGRILQKVEGGGGKRMTKDEFIGIRVDYELKRKLVGLARRRGEPLSSYIRKLLQRHIDKEVKAEV